MSPVMLCGLQYFIYSLATALQIQLVKISHIDSCEISNTILAKCFSFIIQP